MTNELIPLTVKLKLPQFSRFGGQLTFRENGQIFFGTFKPPVFAVSATDSYHTIRHGQENRLDLVSFRYYRTPELWWIIMVANDILSPFDDIESGQVLRIPSLDTVTVYLSRL
jgi:nucleoid-associated protein YgaU